MSLDGPILFLHFLSSPLVSRRIMSSHVLSRLVISSQVMSCLLISFPVCHVTSQPVASYLLVSLHVMSCHEPIAAKCARLLQVVPAIQLDLSIGDCHAKQAGDPRRQERAPPHAPPCRLLGSTGSRQSPQNAAPVCQSCECEPSCMSVCGF